jgi:hypothetical protein
MRTSQDWTDECRYISEVTDKKGRVKEMNYDKAVFVKYCVMQRDAATKQGFFDSATYIQHCIDDLT